jgi:hypothetical protein
MPAEGKTAATIAAAAVVVVEGNSLQLALLPLLAAAVLVGTGVARTTRVLGCGRWACARSLTLAGKIRFFSFLRPFSNPFNHGSFVKSLQIDY